VDSINDALQTALRPASGGIVFAGGLGATEQTITEPSQLFAEQNWVPALIGVVLALLVHLGKSSLRLLANLATLGIAAPVLSTAEETVSLALALLALVAPALIVLALICLAVGFFLLLKHLRRHRATRKARLVG